jgi:hypothetical protein
VRAVEGSDRRGGTHGISWSSSFSGAGVEARETRWCPTGALDAKMTSSKHVNRLAHTMRAACMHIGTRGGYCASRGGTFRVTRTRTRANPNP